MLTLVDTELAFDDLGNGQPVGNVPVRCIPLYQPLWRIVDSVPVEDLSDGVEATTAEDGTWSIVLPWPSEQLPTNTHWLLTRADGTEFTGLPPQDISGPITVEALVYSYGWALVNSPPGARPILAIQGPEGPQGPAGGGGTVTAVSLDMPPQFIVGPGDVDNPITTAGTIEVGWGNEVGHTFLGPPTGGGQPGFRALVPGDLPVATTSTLGAVIAGSGLSIEGGGTLSTSGTAAAGDGLSAGANQWRGAPTGSAARPHAGDR
jgi:hypothetical protein